MIYQVTNTQRKSWNIKIKTKEKVNMLQRPSSLKQMNFKMECFSSLLVTINTVQRWLQHSVVSNNETQSRNSRAVALSTGSMLVYDSIHPWACSQNIGAFHLVYWPWTYFWRILCFVLSWKSISNSMKKKIILRFTFTSYLIQNN